MILLLAVLVGIYSVVLYRLQIIDGAAYYESSQNSIVTRSVVKAARGNILDRYGRTLVSNRTCNNLVIDTDELFARDDPNAVILELVTAVRESGNKYTDTLPITDAPFEYVENMSDLQRTVLNGFIKNANEVNRANLGDNPTAVELMAYIRKRYTIDDSYDAEQTRMIAGIRYELNTHYIIPTSPYIFCQDVSVDLISKLLEQNMPGVDVEVSYIREYNTIFASHLLGYVGQMDASEYEIYKDMGYPMDAEVGKEGVEKAFEQYLHGVDGEAAITTTATGTVTNIVYTKEPEPGNHIYLTMDIGLQEAAEQALANGIANLNAEREKSNAEKVMYGDPSKVEELIPGGALVAIDIKSGEPLCMANFPTYNLSTFFDDYNDLLVDERKPLMNRALQGLYAPGSTFKMVTALAALEEGVVAVNTTIHDDLVFAKYDDYKPRCWIYGKGSHGDVNVTSAIEHSCNYYFYTVGDFLNIGLLSQYAFKFGLGVITGIELPEATGIMSTREYKEETFDTPWYDGDTLQASIGQSFSRFSPLQIAHYVATFAADGTRYGTSVLKTVRSYDFSDKLLTRQPQVLGEVGGEPEYYDAIKQGMLAVARTGTAMEIFRDYPYQVAAKTGTAQMGEDVMNNAVFVCYAPYDDPQIAIALVVEKGGAGSAVGTIARDVLDYYFNFASSTVALETENILLK